MPLVLQAEEVAPLLDMRKAIASVEDAYAQQGEGRLGEHAPYFVRGGAAEGGLRVVSGALWRSERMGIRLVPRVVVPGATGARGPSYQVPTGHAIALLYSTAGDLLAIMGYPFGTLRTGAVVALATKHLAREDAKRVGLIGPGRNALDVLHGVSCVRPIESIRVFGRNPQRRREFCEQASELMGLPVEPVEDPRDAVSGMDVLLTQTDSLEPVFAPEWLEDGQFVSASGTPRIGEIHPDVLRRAKQVVVGSKEHVRNFIWQLPAVIGDPPRPVLDLIDAGELTWEGIDELGDLVSGRAPGRQNTEDVTFFHESAGGPTDVALVETAYQEACRLGLGRSIDL